MQWSQSRTSCVPVSGPSQELAASPFPVHCFLEFRICRRGRELGGPAARFRARSVKEIGKLWHVIYRGPCAITSSRGQGPLTIYASGNRSGRSGHQRPRAATTGSGPPATGSVRPVRGRAANSFPAPEIGDGARGAMLPLSANQCNDPGWALCRPKARSATSPRRETGASGDGGDPSAARRPAPNGVNGKSGRSSRLVPYSRS